MSEGNNIISKSIDEGILLIGPSGVGKSVFFCASTGKPIKVTEQDGELIQTDNVNDENERRIATDMYSKTQRPEEHQYLSNETLIDTNGTGDNEGPKKDIQNLFQLDKIIQVTNSIKIIFVEPQSSIRDQKGVNFVERIIQQTNMFRDVDALKGCVSLLITRVKPKQTISDVVTKIKNLIECNKNLHEKHKNFINECITRVYVMHEPKDEDLQPQEQWNELQENITGSMQYKKVDKNALTFPVPRNVKEIAKKLFDESEKFFKNSLKKCHEHIESFLSDINSNQNEVIESRIQTEIDYNSKSIKNFYGLHNWISGILGKPSQYNKLPTPKNLIKLLDIEDITILEMAYNQIISQNLDLEKFKESKTYIQKILKKHQDKEKNKNIIESLDEENRLMDEKIDFLLFFTKLCDVQINIENEIQDFHNSKTKLTEAMNNDVNDINDVPPGQSFDIYQSQFNTLTMERYKDRQNLKDVSAKCKYQMGLLRFEEGKQNECCENQKEAIELHANQETMEVTLFPEIFNDICNACIKDAKSIYIFDTKVLEKVQSEFSKKFNATLTSLQTLINEKFLQQDIIIKLYSDELEFLDDLDGLRLHLINISSFTSIQSDLNEVFYCVENHQLIFNKIVMLKGMQHAQNQIEAEEFKTQFKDQFGGLVKINYMLNQNHSAELNSWFNNSKLFDLYTQTNNMEIQTILNLNTDKYQNDLEQLGRVITFNSQLENQKAKNNCAQGFFQIAKIILNTDKDQAIEQLREVLKQNKENQEATYMLADLLQEQHSINDSKEKLNEAFKLYQQMQNYIDAENCLKLQIISLNQRSKSNLENNAETYEKLAQFQFDWGMYEESVKQWNMAASNYSRLINKDRIQHVRNQIKNQTNLIDTHNQINTNWKKQVESTADGSESILPTNVSETISNVINDNVKWDGLDKLKLFTSNLKITVGSGTTLDEQVQKEKELNENPISIQSQQSQDDNQDISLDKN